MSFKNNYIKFAGKFGGPYTLMKRGLKRSTINSIMDGSVPLADTAYKVAKALGVTVEELVEKKEGLREGVAEKVLEGYAEKLTEEERYIDKLTAILQGKNEAIKELITCFLDTIASNKEWINAGKPERRKKKPSPLHAGRHERRNKIHSY